MDDRGATSDRMSPHSRFEFAPPRRFLLPAVLLLLAEQPGYGYHLVKELQGFGFGHVDRPSVYRALAQLETDGLVEASAEAPRAGHERRVYQLTEHGEQILRAWMGVIRDERDHLESVLRRYRATGSVDAVMADVDARWASMLGPAWSTVSAPSPVARFTVVEPADDRRAPWEAGPRMGRFLVVPDRSVILVEVRSSVGPLSFGAAGLTGSVEAVVTDGMIAISPPPAAHLEVAVGELQSGNRLYDAELGRRIDARRFPIASVELRHVSMIGAPERYRLTGELTFHGVTRPIQGTVKATLVSHRQLVVTGEQAFDIRDFAIASPTVLMLRIYPDVRVRLHAEAELYDDPDDPAEEE